MTLQIRDHARLQAAVARAMLAGIGVALSGVLLNGGWTDPLVVALDVLALGVAVVLPKSWRGLAVATVLAALAGGAWRIGGLWGLLLTGTLTGLMYLRDLPVSGRGRRLAAFAAGAAALAAGAAIADELLHNHVFYFMPGELERVVLGAGFGLFAGLGVVGRELTVVKAAAVARPALPKLGGELGVLVERASRAWSEAQGALGAETSDVHSAASDLMGKIERFAVRWHDLEKELAATDRPALAERLSGVIARQTAATDEVVREEYASARAALERQSEYLDGIERGRDRAVARLHHHVAVVERLRLAALHHRAVTAGRVGEELAPLVNDLVAAGRDLDCEAEAIAELPAAIH